MSRGLVRWRPGALGALVTLGVCFIHARALAEEAADPYDATTQEEAQATKHSGPVAPWSGQLFLIGVGITDGSAAAPDQGVMEPTLFWSFGLSFSMWYVYLATGFELLNFEDRQPLVQDVYDPEQGEHTVAASATSLGGCIEAGLNYPLLIPLNAEDFIELVPTVTYGLYGVGPLSRNVEHCVDCLSDDVDVDYGGGDFLGLSLGAFWASGVPLRGAFGLTSSYRHYLHPGDARLTRQLLFAATIRLARGP